jgi:hypothetical protein
MRSATRERIGKDPLYLHWIGTLPCCVCEVNIANQDTARTWEQRTPTERAHLGPRGLSQKVPDRRVVPLCTFHHRGSVASLHALGPKVFWMQRGLDPEELITKYNERFDNGERAA